MNVAKVRIPSIIKNIAVTAPLLFATQVAMPKSYDLQEDVFVKSEKVEKKDKTELSPKVKLAGQDVYPALVLDLSDELLYHYDLDGYLMEEYPVRFVEGEINPGLNLVEVTEHNYGANRTSPKIILTKVNQRNGKIANTHKQVIVGSKGKTKDDDSGIFTNVVLVDNDVAHKITEFLTDEQYVLIRK